MLKISCQFGPYVNARHTPAARRAAAYTAQDKPPSPAVHTTVHTTATRGGRKTGLPATHSLPDTWRTSCFRQTPAYKEHARTCGQKGAYHSKPAAPPMHTRASAPPAPAHRTARVPHCQQVSWRAQCGPRAFRCACVAQPITVAV
eukprot:364681-Chlamydomonas_euryale.AAC.16